MGNKRTLIMLFFTFILSMALAAQDKMVLSHSGEDHPFYKSSKMILIEAYSRLGIDLELKQFPLERSAVVANSGTVDGELFRGEFEQSLYPNLLRVPVAIAVGEISAFTNDLEFEVTGWESLKPYRLGTQNGLKPAEEGASGMNLKKVTEGEQLFKMLKAGRIDVVILPKDVGQMNMIEAGFPSARLLEPPIQRDFIYHYVNSKYKSLIPKLEVELTKMKEEGFF